VPRYDYRCEAGHKYERQEPFGSPAVHPCERCGKPARRVLVAPPLVFKGRGFYKTSGRSGDSDGASSGGASGGKSTAKPKAETAKDSETKSKRAERVKASD
jgi:putative FmdB family regulatory protein